MPASEEGSTNRGKPYSSAIQMDYHYDTTDKGSEEEDKVGGIFETAFQCAKPDGNGEGVSAKLQAKRRTWEDDGALKQHKK